MRDSDSSEPIEKKNYGLFIGVDTIVKQASTSNRPIFGCESLSLEWCIKYVHVFSDIKLFN